MKSICARRRPGPLPGPSLLLLAALPLLLGGCTACVEHPEDVMRLLAEGKRLEAGDGFTAIPEEERVRVEPEAPQPYRLGVGDVVYVSVPGQEAYAGFGETAKGDLVGTRVKEDGNLYLPLIQRVPAVGKTVIEIQADIEERLKQFVPAPFVSVDVLEHRSQKFFVLGEIESPGAYAVDGRTTLIEAISNAGGPHNGDADLEEAYVIRDGKVLPISIADVLQRGDVSGNLTMRDRDLIFVPHKKQRENQVFVLGEVKTPGPVPMEDGRRLTLTAALAAAGGLDAGFAAEDQIRIFRGGWKYPRAYTVSAHEVYKYGESLLLAPGDRVFVAPTGLATWGRALSQLTPFLGIAGVATGIVAIATN